MAHFITEDLEGINFFLNAISILLLARNRLNTISWLLILYHYNVEASTEFN